MSWPLVKLSEVCTFLTGGTPSKNVPEYFDGGEIPWIVSGDINRGIVTDVDGRITTAGMENSPAKFLPLNSVLIALNGQGRTRATVALLKLEGATCNQSIVAMSPKSTGTLYYRFLFTILRSMYQQLRDLTGDEKRSGLNIGLLKNVAIPLPPMAEQKRIARILDAADALRVKRREALAQLDTLLQSTFLDMFGDPVANPMGWKVCLLGEKATRITKGQSPKWQGFEYQDDGVLFVTSENVREGFLNVSKPKFVPSDFNEKLRSSQLRTGDLLINLVGASIGRSCLFNGYSGAANINQAVGVVTLDDPVLSNYIVQLLQTKQGQSFLTGRIVEAARANISLKNLRELSLPLPPVDLQFRFATIVESVERQKARMRTHLAELDALFASLQFRAFSGTL